MTAKPNIRWQLLLALVCLGLVFSLLSFQVQTVGLCTTRVPADGGSYVEGIVGAPQHLNPLLSDSNPVDREIASLLFDGLTRYDESGRLVPAIARDWEVGEDGLTVTFTLDETARWHDGESVSADDVVFTYGLLQDEAFPAPAGLRSLWQNVAISSTNGSQVTFTLPEPYSPFLSATTRGILPEHILGDVPPEEIPDHQFNLAPTGTGPFLVPRGENWERTGRLHLVPTSDHWQQGVKLDNIEFRFFPDAEQMVNALASGEIHALNRVPEGSFSEVARIEGTRLYSAPLPRYAQLLFNFGEEADSLTREGEVRQALAFSLERQQLIDDALDGQALPLHGPYLPSSWAYNPGPLTAYAFNTISATTGLEGAGWLLPEGGGIRERDGAKLSLRLLTLDQPMSRAVAESLSDQWAAIGVEIQPVAVDSERYREALRVREFDIALVEVATLGDPDLYDFWSQEAIVRGQNYAAWNHRRASEALEQARQVWDESERRSFYDLFLQYYGASLPALTLYQPVYTYAASDVVNNVDIGRIDFPRERYESLPDWFLLFRDVTIACPEDGAAPET